MFEISFRKKNPLELWGFYREEFLKIYAHEQSKELTHASLERWFIDSKGKQYDKFPKNMALPIERLGKLKGFITWMSAGISGEEMKQFRETGNKILSDGLGDTKTAARMGALFNVLEEREKMCVHTELMYNILAIQAIREDEQPDIYNNEIHIEKVNQFKEEVDNHNSYFFFQEKELMLPFDFSKISIAEWTALWHESLTHQEAFKEILDLLHRGVKSSGKARI